jgi:hypothetical protein
MGGWDSVIRDSSMGSGKRYKTSGGGKPPKKGCGKKALVLLLFGIGATAAVGNAIWQSLT